MPSCLKTSLTAAELYQRLGEIVSVLRDAPDAPAPPTAPPSVVALGEVRAITAELGRRGPRAPTTAARLRALGLEGSIAGELEGQLRDGCRRWTLRLGQLAHALFDGAPAERAARLLKTRAGGRLARWFAASRLALPATGRGPVSVPALLADAREAVAPGRLVELDPEHRLAVSATCGALLADVAPVAVAAARDTSRLLPLLSRPEAEAAWREMPAWLIEQLLSELAADRARSRPPRRLQRAPHAAARSPLRRRLASAALDQDVVLRALRRERRGEAVIITRVVQVRVTRPYGAAPLALMPRPALEVQAPPPLDAEGRFYPLE